MIDPVTMEVLRNAFFMVAEEMGVILQRSAYSSNIKTRLDFSCAIFDDKLRNIAQALHQPAHLGSLIHSVPKIIKEYGVENLSPGDGILYNDPFKGSVHLPDVSLVSPVFHGSEIFGYVVNLAHHQDIGGKTPGSVPGDTTEIYQEGLILPGIKLIEKGRIQGDVLKMILANVRGAEKRAGDYRAQIAANKAGVAGVKAIIERYGVETLKTYLDEILDYTERRMRAELEKIPDGTYVAEDYLDSDGVSQNPVKIHVEVRVEGSDVTVDLSGSDKQGDGPMNAPYGATLAAVSYIFKTLIGKDIPINDGMYRPIHIIAPEGLVVNAKPPAAVAGCWEVAIRVADTVLKAMAQALPDKVCAAGKGVICNVSFGGIDPRNGRVYAFLETVAGGYGGRLGMDGMDAVQYHTQNTENAPVEEVEMSLPVVVERYELIPDSEGAGKYRGGLGLRRDYRFYDHSATFSILSERARFPPWGLFGGREARCAKYIINPESRNPVILPSKATIKLKPGDIVSVQTPGGGGYGDPLERDPEKVLIDVRDGKVSLERAKKIYGVIIENGKINYEATQKLRKKALSKDIYL